MDSEMQLKASKSWKTKALEILLVIGLAVAGFVLGGFAGAVAVNISVVLKVPMSIAEKHQCVWIGMMMGFALAPCMFFSVRDAANR